MKRICAVPALLIISTAGCSETTSDDPNQGDPVEPSFEEHACAISPPDGLTLDDFRCGTLTTVFDRDTPDARTVSIEAAVLRARNGDTDAPPLLFFGGGPGVYNLDSYLPAQAAGALAPINEVRDVVFFDPRGLGQSRPSLACPELGETLTEAYMRAQSSADDAENGWLAGYRACHERLVADGVDLSQHHSAAIVEDAAELMEALGYESYHVYGISYGGRLVQVMLRDRPEAVVSAILDSTTLVEESFGTQWSANLDRSLQEMFDECATAPSCADANPELEQTFYDVIEALNDTPLSLDVETSDGPVTLLVTGDRFANGIANSLYVADLIPLLPVAISVTATGSDLIVQQFGAALLPSVATLDYGHYASVLCAEEIVFDSEGSLDEAEQGVPQPIVDAWGAVNGPLFLDLCEFWEVEPRPSIEREPVESDIPALVLSGQFDPATPPSYGERAAANLSNSQYLLFPGVGHGVLRSVTREDDSPRCAQQVVVDFLADPASPVDGSCAAALPSPF